MEVLVRAHGLEVAVQIQKIWTKAKVLPESIFRDQSYSTAKGWHTQLLTSINTRITSSHRIIARWWRRPWWTSRATENFSSGLEAIAVMKTSSTVPTALQQHQSSPLEIKKNVTHPWTPFLLLVFLYVLPYNTHLMSEEQSFELSFTPVVQSIRQQLHG